MHDTLRILADAHRYAVRAVARSHTQRKLYQAEQDDTAPISQLDLLRLKIASRESGSGTPKPKRTR